MTCSKLALAADGGALDVAVDSHENVYVVGLLESDATFGGHTLYQIGARDAFVASFTADGTYRWAKRFGVSGGGLAGAYAIAVDASDNIYIAGGAASGVDFGGGPLYTSGFGQFVASFDAAGNHRWSRNDGGNGALGVATTGTHVFTIGRFTSSIAIGSLPPLTAVGAEDVVIASFDVATGAPAWARRFGTAATDYEGGIVAHDDWIAYSAASAQTGHRLVSYTEAGADRWTVTLPDALDDSGLAVDATGNLYLSGRHYWGQDIVPGTPYSIAGDNVFIHAFSSAGASRWSWTLPESPARHVTAIPYTPIAIDSAGRPVLAGTFVNSIYAGGPALVNAVQPARDDLFFATFAADGTPVAARHPVETAASVYAHGAAIDAHGRIYVAGIYYGTVDFGDGPLPFASSGGLFLFRSVP